MRVTPSELHLKSGPGVAEVWVQGVSPVLPMVAFKTDVSLLRLRGGFITLYNCMKGHCREVGGVSLFSQVTGNKTKKIDSSCTMEG